MKIKKILMILGIVGISVGTIFGVLAPSEASDFSDISTHKGEKPLKTFKYEKTGVVVEVYASNSEDAVKIKKEAGWKDGEVEVVKEPLEKLKDRKEMLKEKEQAKDTAKSQPTSFLDSPINFLKKSFGTNNAYAGAGTWDYLGSEPWYMGGDNSITYDDVYLSHGGDYMIRVPAHTRTGGVWSNALVYLMEEDPLVPDTQVGTFYIYPSSYAMDYVVRDISNFCDGTDGLAEFYTMHYSHYSVSGNYIRNVQYYD